MTAALRHHREGRLDAAEPLYRRLLDMVPGHADARHLLGVLIHQRGRHEEAASLIVEAIRIESGIPDYHSNLGLVLAALGRLDESAACHRRALALRADYVEAHFNLGLVLVALGRVSEAVAHYAEAARLRPDFADAHLNLGAALQDLGRPEEALAAHARAAELLPGDPRPWSNMAVTMRQLGQSAEADEALRQAMARGGAADAGSLMALAGALHAEGRLIEAADAYAEALRLDGQNPLLLNNFGLLLRDIGQPEDAVTCFEAAFALKPDYAEAYDNLGSLKAAQGRTIEAEACHRAALAYRGDMAAAWNNLGNAIKAHGRLDAALACWRMAVTLEPGRAEVYSNLGNGLRQRERFAEAERCHRRALLLMPSQAAANNNYGHALQGQLHHAEAARWFRRALALNPAYAEALSNLGLALQRLGDRVAAETAYGRALALQPELALAHFNRALLRLEQGDLTEGWPGYGWRFASGQVGAGRQPAMSAWRGEDLTGKRLLVWGEQGVGDTILFASMLEDVIVRARAVVIEVDRRLVPLFARSFPKASVREPTVLRDCDLHVPMGSLARVFRPALANFPARPGWLVFDPVQATLWRDRLASLGPGLKVGIGWRSQFITEERRSAYVALDQWEPLFTLPGVVFVNLQYGDCEGELAAVEGRFGVRIHRWADLDLKDDFDGTAGLIAALDLVISPAMSVGELAGALGVPVWRFGGRDWTQLGTGARPWFPTQRLFQPRAGEALGDVLAQMAQALAPTTLPTPSCPDSIDGREAEHLLAQGLRHHRAGDLPTAERFYRRVLDRDQQHPDALHLMGVLAHQIGRHDAAAELIGRALAQRDVAEYHGNLGSVLQALDRPDEAVIHYERALTLRPDYPDALNGLGSALQELNRLTEAEARYRAALAQRPDFPEALGNLGTVLHAQGRFDEALACLVEAVARDRGSPDARMGLGALLSDLGRLAKAEEQYREAVALASSDPEAHAGLGKILFQRGRYAEAAASLERTVELGGRRAATLDLLGAARRLNGDPAGAERWHRLALRAEPTRSSAHTNLGLALSAQGCFAQADECYRRALALAPAGAETLNNLGVSLQNSSAVREAVVCHRRAARLRPTLAETWGNLGAALLRLRRHDGTVAACGTALLLKPDLAGAWTTRGAALKALRRFGEAIRNHRRALRVAPTHAKAWSNLGTALAGEARWDDAIAVQYLALSLAPDFADAYLNLGHAEQVRGRAVLAERLAERALIVNPSQSKARVNRALLLLARGDLEQGWADYGQRFAGGEAGPQRVFPVPEWHGEDLAGKTLLVWAEQGLGDEIMFGSTLPDLQTFGGRLIVECDPRLVPLFARALSGAEVRAATEFPSDCDLHVPMGTVASRLRSRRSDFPVRASYLTPEAGLAARWRERLSVLGPGLTVGIGWRSGLVTAERAGAYTRLDQWGPVFAVPGLRFVNLQYGDCAAEIAEAERRFGVVIHRWADLDLKNDLEGLAALIAGLDLVLAAPTSVGELAGALGTPVWRIGGQDDWSRLGVGVRPWFPAMRLISPEPGGGLDDALLRAAQSIARLGRSAPPQKLIVD
nr:tetratricopeptide repeat protein [Azospirillum soli]